MRKITWTQTGPFAFSTANDRIKVDKHPQYGFEVGLDGEVESIEDSLEAAFLAAKEIAQDNGIRLN